MEITEVRIYPYKARNSKLRAFASVTFDEEFAVKGIKVMDGKKGLFISMPAQASSEGEYYDVAYPITKKFREELEDAVITAFEEEDEEEEKPKKKSSKKSSKKSTSKKSKKKAKEDDEDEDEEEDDEDIPF